VAWGGQTRDVYKADLLISAYDRKGLIRDVGNMLVSCHSDLLAINTSVDELNSRTEIRLTAKVADFEHLSYVLNRLSALPNVYDVKRIG
jgi:GTP pyrophosphokinase